MREQLIISVGREFGSGGHEIAQKLADRYQLPLYDRNLLDEMAAHKGMDSKLLAEIDEKKKNKLLSRTVRGMSNCPAQNVAELQFAYIREKADAGESFVIVGRCSETILRDYPAMISFFILGDKDVKVERIMRLYQKSPSEAEAFAQEQDKKRRQYHNSHCSGKWGDSRNYELSINSSKIGVDETVEVISRYIDARFTQQ